MFFHRKKKNFELATLNVNVKIQNVANCEQKNLDEDDDDKSIAQIES